MNEFKLCYQINNTYDDFMRADYKVLMSFTCEPNTVDSIILRNNMKPIVEKDDDRLIFETPIIWWNVDLVEKAEPYKVGEEQVYWKYLWYDSVSKQALYQEFSL